ncbi:hypothetical protein ABL78_2688 [Leptomonas seymouri]|uniref:Uncharacterized protein n=1 Tax=Leptomonas seymouri TaxID=5684 RepID=A0A0N1ILR3_LEPSE|nr:hypothetical protein ABL78_2688 [Leptomonas seymouri]|eukprot:KPI88184.1 hypothetical protein ABL78_2688 [Leptomonas seymouri]
MGCGSSHDTYVCNPNAYRGYAMASLSTPRSPGGRNFNTAQRNLGLWEPHAGSNRVAGSNRCFNGDDEVLRRMRQKHMEVHPKASKGVAQGKRRASSPRTHCSNLINIGSRQLGIVDELSASAYIGRLLVGDGTRPNDRSLPSSSSSGYSTFVSLASLLFDSKFPKHISSGDEVTPHMSYRRPSSYAHASGLFTNLSTSVYSSSSLFGRKKRPLQRYKLNVCNNGHAHRVRLVLLAPQGDILLSCSTVDCHMVAYHLHLKEEVGYLFGHKAVILGGAVSPDGRLVATSSNDCTAILWELLLFKPRYSLPHPSAVHACRFSSSGLEVATMCADGICRVWTWDDIGVMHMLVSFNTGFDRALTSLTYTLGDRQLVAGGASNTIFLWDRQHLEEAGTAFRQHCSTVISVDASQVLLDIVVSADESKVYVWNSDTLEVLHCINVDACNLPRQCPRRQKALTCAAAGAELANTELTHSPYWTAMQLVDTRYGVFVVAAASDKCAHIFEVQDTAQKTGDGDVTPLDAHVSEVLSLPFSSSLSCVNGGPLNLISLGDTCGNRHILALM